MNRLYYFSLLYFFILSLFFCSNSVFASARPYLGIDVGTDIINTSKQTAGINLGNVIDYYTANNKYTNSMVGGLNTGIEVAKKHKRYLVDIGVGWYGVPSSLNYTGQLIECSSCANDLISNYRFKLHTQRAMLEARINGLASHKLVPYIDGGLGVAFNRLSGFQETAASSDNYLPYPPFQSRTSTNFAYQVGLGLGYKVKIFTSYPNAERIMIGYRYAYLGEAVLNKRDSEYPYRLKIGNLNDDEIYFSYICVF